MAAHTFLVEIRGWPDQSVEADGVKQDDGFFVFYLVREWDPEKRGKTRDTEDQRIAWFNKLDVVSIHKKVTAA